MANLFSTKDGKEHLLTGRHSAPGFAKMLIGCLSGDDLDRAKLYSTDPGAIIKSLRRTYIVKGLGLTLTHQQILNLKKPHEKMDMGPRMNLIRNNCSLPVKK